jgi:CubicO group peptidase (beta-lactamase class C family)
MMIEVECERRRGLERVASGIAAWSICLLAPCTQAGERSVLEDAEAIVARLDETIPEVVARGNSPSIQVAVVHHGKVIWSRAFGEGAGVETVYMNASVQKVYEAVAVLQLSERGLVDLEADVSTYLPFEVKHPQCPDVPITLRMLLCHRSGLGTCANQFEWDTGGAFSPRFRPACDAALVAMPLEEFLVASLTPEGSNYSASVWERKPDEEYRYSNTAWPLLRYLVARVSERGFQEYMREDIFEPLGMASSGYRAEAFEGRNAPPYTRSGTENIKLSIWDGSGSMMRTTAEDQARFMVALLDESAPSDPPLLRPETIERMKKPQSYFRGFVRTGRDLKSTGYGLGLHTLLGGWYGHGGSSPGYQCLWRFHPENRVGYVIHSNVNAILTGGDNYDSVREEIYTVQDALYEILDS